MKVLIIEDNDIIRKNIQKYLEVKGHQADEHETYEGSTYKIMTGGYDIIILDLGLGSKEGDGIDICKQIREKGSSIPILMLTARNLIPEKIEGLEAGADDYMTKPFDYGELLARLKTMVRRDHSLKGNQMNIGDISIKVDEMLVSKAGEEVSLSKLEFDLLLFFAQNQARVLKKEEIMEKVWGEIDMFKESRAVDIYVGYLRKKLGKDVVKTVRGAGYIMEENNG